ncbi:MAG: hypothetical protein EOO15_04525 [Chitinophagaceae bacterium]|nr:MAG: hypothetical protein EOO15_04525 [Chitinophagaceae bacterium]
MKKIFWLAALLLSSAWAGAQSSGAGTGSRNTASVSASGNSDRPMHTAKKRVTIKDKKGRKKTITRTVPLREDKEYKWKDGQSATPTGHEATGINESGAVAAPRKDSSYVPKPRPRRK